MITATKPLSTKELSALYDRIYNIADRLFKKHNPCNICTKNKKLCCTGYPTGRERLCCEGCWDMKTDHYSLFGCTTKCLACKIYLCTSVNKENKLLVHRLFRLRDIAHRYIPYLLCYQSKEQWLKLIKESYENS